MVRQIWASHDLQSVYLPRFRSRGLQLRRAEQAANMISLYHRSAQQGPEPERAGECILNSDTSAAVFRS